MSTGTRPRGQEQGPRNSSDPQSEIADAVDRGAERLGTSIRESADGLGASMLSAARSLGDRVAFELRAELARRGTQQPDESSTPRPRSRRPPSPETPIDQLDVAKALELLGRGRRRR